MLGVFEEKECMIHKIILISYFDLFYSYILVTLNGWLADMTKGEEIIWMLI